MSKKKTAGRGGLGQLLIPVIAIALLVVFNLIRDPGFFSVELRENSAQTRCFPAT